MDLSLTDLISINKSNIVNEVDSNSIVIEVKVGVKTAKSKSKNSVKPFLAKSKLFAENSELCFLTFKARLVFTKLRQAFIKASILHHFNSKYHIYIETNISNYTINRILSYLTSNNLD